MINKAGKSSANQNGGRISVRYLELETEHPPMAPNSTVKTSYFWSGGLSYCALGAAAVRIRFSSVILNLEERWAEFAQLFTFYWDLTRNKFSFPLSFFVTRSPLFIWTLGDAILESGRNRFGDHLEYWSSLEELNEDHGWIAGPQEWKHPPYHLRSSRW